MCTVIFLTGFFAVTRAQQLQVYDLWCDSKVNPVGIDDPAPRLSWKLKAEGMNILQQAYSLRVATAADFKKEHLVWESGKTGGDESAYVPYRGPALKPATRYYWQVKVWDNRKRESPWSGTAFWETGILAPSGWKATWIEPVQDTARSLGTNIPALMVRKDFNISKKIVSARAYVTSHGFYELSINGRKVGDELLTPGWTSYNKRLQYQVYDITPYLQQGSNAVGAFLGDGWYRGRLGWAENFGVWGKTLGLLCQLSIRYADGSEETIVSDKSWKGTGDGPIVMNSIYDGETYDARKELDGWN
ncbi:MAG TPA: alpha-L-rhamnosidase N-terminal domain-containing protein, partial [Chryseosolibacter sp.]